MALRRVVIGNHCHGDSPVSPRARETPPVHDKRLGWLNRNANAATSRPGAETPCPPPCATCGRHDPEAADQEPIGASDPHVAPVRRISPGRVSGHAHARDRDNGFANRFIIFHAERPRLEPFPRTTPDSVCGGQPPSAGSLSFARAHTAGTFDPASASQNRRRMRMSCEAPALYARLYRGNWNSQKGR